MINNTNLIVDANDDAVVGNPVFDNTCNSVYDKWLYDDTVHELKYEQYKTNLRDVSDSISYKNTISVRHYIRIANKDNMRINRTWE